MRVRLAIGALLLAACTVPVPEQRPLRQSAILIVVDTLRRDHLHAYGYGRATSGHIDTLAAEGLRFERAYAQAPWTTPSVASLLTSRYPSELGIRLAPDRLDDGFLTLAETLHGAGYRTGAVVSHSFLGKDWNFHQGFESFDESNVAGHAASQAPGVTDRALEFARLHAGQPFFLLVHYFDPHYDYLEHAHFRFGEEASYRGPISSGIPYGELVSLVGRLTPADRQRLLDLYDSEVAFTDRHVGRLLRGLRRLGLYDHSLVLLTADHGEEFLEHGGVGHGGTLFNEVIQVPLIIKPPAGRVPPATRADPVALLDVFPTVLEILGVPSPADLRGRSLLPVAAAGPPPRPVWSETDWGRLRAGIVGPFKIILNVDSQHVGYFDVVRDPGETNNLIQRRYRPRVGESYAPLRAALDGWRAEMERAVFEAPEVALSDEATWELRALGYLR